MHQSAAVALASFFAFFPTSQEISRTLTPPQPQPLFATFFRTAIAMAHLDHSWLCIGSSKFDTTNLLNLQDSHDIYDMIFSYLFISDDTQLNLWSHGQVLSLDSLDDRHLDYISSPGLPGGSSASGVQIWNSGWRFNRPWAESWNRWGTLRIAVPTFVWKQDTPKSHGLSPFSLNGSG